MTLYLYRSDPEDIKLKNIYDNFSPRLAIYHIIPNKCTLCEGNGLEIHNLSSMIITMSSRDIES